LIKRGDVDGAMRNYGEAFKTFLQTRDARGVGYTLCAIGKTLTSNGVTEQGWACIRKAGMFFRGHGLAFGQEQTHAAQEIVQGHLGTKVLREINELGSRVSPTEFIGRLTRNALSLSSSSIAAGWAFLASAE
jgi:hypothetical protein